MSVLDCYSLLAGLYQTAREAVGVARRANLPIPFIETEGTAMIVWSSILSEALKRKMLASIEAVVTQDYPGVEIGPALRALGSPKVQPPLQFQWSPAVNNYEKITGAQPTLLPIRFLAKGIERARSVVRVICHDGSYGSGFLIEKNLLITNHHVLGTVEDAETARVEFGYELNDLDTIRASASFGLDPQNGFHTSDTHDWTAVRLTGDANKDWGAIPLVEAIAKPEQFVNIIQHPGGGPKQIALYHNLVVFANAEIIQYLTDTMPGSSGSPVFNSDWRLVAIHHAGGWLKQPDKPETRFCNEGIASNILVEGIAKASLC